MSRGRDPACWRELRVELRRLGGSPVRVTGSHETWRFDDGGTFIVVRNHLNDAVPVGILVKFRRMRWRRRAAAGEEPVLLGRDPRPWAKQAAKAARKVQARRAAGAELEGWRQQAEGQRRRGIAPLSKSVQNAGRPERFHRKSVALKRLTTQSVRFPDV